MRPAAAALTDAAAEHQHVDHPPVVHVHVIPVVYPGPEDNHRPAMCLMGGVGELAGNLLDMTTRDAGDLLPPGWSVGFDLGVLFCRVHVVQPAVKAVVRQHQVIHAGHPHLAAINQGEGFGRHLADKHRVLFHAAKMRILVTAKVREGDVGHLAVGTQQGQGQVGLLARRQRFQVPFAFFAPAEADRAVGHHQIARAIEGDRFPLRIIAFAQPVGEVRGAQHSAGDKATVLARVQHHQHRHVRVAAAVVEEVVARVIEVELFEDHMAHGHGQSAVGALFRGQPLVAEFGNFREVGGNGDGFGAFVTDFGKEVGIRGAGLRHV
ncbi:hypothetical protein D3C75_656450 [compost metagenome]